MVDVAASVWRDFVIDGVPSSGSWAPRKADIRAWGTWVETSSFVNVKDFGAVGDGVADDTAAIQAAVNAAGAQKRGLYAPGGTYNHSEITLPQRPTRIVGDGPSKTVFVNTVAGGNAFKFIATGGNRDPDDFALIKSVQFADLSIMKNTADGGIGIWVEWVKNDTNNQVYFSADNVQVYCDKGTSWSFTKGIYLKNCNGSSWNNVVVKGDNSESASASANPYTMTHAIHFDQDTVGLTTGNINHYITNITTGASGYGLRVDGWYEGFFITNSSFVQHWKGVSNSGSAALNSVFNLVNCHMDCRVYPLEFTSTFKLHVVNCDLFKNGTGAGFAGDTAKLFDCMHASFIGCTFSTGDTTLPIGINANSGCFRMTVVGNNFQSCSNGVVLNCTTNGALVQGNIFYNCSVGVLLFTGTADNRIGLNAYNGTFTARISNLSSGYNHITPFKYTVQATVNFASALATQTVTFAVPAGIFVATPIFATLTPAFNSGFYPVIVYDSTASSPTSLVFVVREYQAATIAAGNYVFCATAESFS
ncbi:glycosyl hydrolase family 28-related protein [Mesorhizobium sp. 2RAF45]|uniref:glycosyl hydrolase family 28-related protein n=1 Tax=Mesorhizobium sp. 2RAF45 TaxID=3233001 RepID=UPI003F9BA38C